MAGEGSPPPGRREGDPGRQGRPVRQEGDPRRQAGRWTLAMAPPQRIRLAGEEFHLPSTPVDVTTGGVIWHPPAPGDPYLSVVHSPLGERLTRFGPRPIRFQTRTRPRAQAMGEALLDLPPEEREQRGRAMMERRMRRKFG